MSGHWLPRHGRPTSTLEAVLQTAVRLFANPGVYAAVVLLLTLVVFMVTRS